MHNRFDILSADVLQQYLKGELSPEKKGEIEALLAQDPMAADALEGLQKMENPASLAEFVPTIQIKIQKLLSRKRNRKFIRVSVLQYLVAAAVILLLWLSFLMLKTVEKQQNKNSIKDSTQIIPLRTDSILQKKDSLISPPKKDSNASPKEKNVTPNKEKAKANPPISVYSPQSRMMDSLERLLHNQVPKIEHTPTINKAKLPHTNPPKGKIRPKIKPSQNASIATASTDIQQPDLEFLQGIDAYKKGDYELALRLFQSISKQSPFYREALLKQADCRAKMKDTK